MSHFSYLIFSLKHIALLHFLNPHLNSLSFKIGVILRMIHQIFLPHIKFTNFQKLSNLSFSHNHIIITKRRRTISKRTKLLFNFVSVNQLRFIVLIKLRLDSLFGNCLKIMLIRNIRHNCKVIPPYNFKILPCVFNSL